jgi:hypothetical protein
MCKHSEPHAPNIHSGAQAFVLVRQRTSLCQHDQGRVPRLTMVLTAVFVPHVCGPDAPRSRRAPFPLAELGPVPGSYRSGTAVGTGAGTEARVGIGGWLECVRLSATPMLVLYVKRLRSNRQWFVPPRVLATGVVLRLFVG